MAPIALNAFQIGSDPIISQPLILFTLLDLTYHVKESFYHRANVRLLCTRGHAWNPLQTRRKRIFFNGANPKIVPFAGQYNGKDGAMQYFMALGSNVQTTHIQPSNFREEGNKVIHDVQQDGIVNATGKPFTSKMVFTWEFNDSGLAISWNASGDYSSLEAAFSN